MLALAIGLAPTGAQAQNDKFLDFNISLFSAGAAQHSQTFQAPQPQVAYVTQPVPVYCPAVVCAPQPVYCSAPVYCPPQPCYGPSEVFRPRPYYAATTTFVVPPQPYYQPVTTCYAPPCPRPAATVSVSTWNDSFYGYPSATFVEVTAQRHRQ